MAEKERKRFNCAERTDRQGDSTGGAIPVFGTSPYTDEANRMAWWNERRKEVLRLLSATDSESQAQCSHGDRAD